MNRTSVSSEGEILRQLAGQLLRKLQASEGTDVAWPGYSRRQDTPRFSQRNTQPQSTKNLKKPWGW